MTLIEQLHRPAEVVHVGDADWPLDASALPRFDAGSHHVPDDVVAHCGPALAPEPVAAALASFRADPGPVGAVVLRGLPIGRIGATPPTPTSPLDKDTVSEVVLLTAARCLGEPVGYLPEHGGRLVQHLVPTEAGADRQISTSSKVTLMFHTETAFHPHKPRYLLLLCLRGDPGAHTTLASVHEIVGRLAPSQRRIIAEPRFRTAVDASFLPDDHEGASPLTPPRPLIERDGRDGRLAFTFDADLMVGIDPEAEAALEALRRIVEEHQTSVCLEPGDLLVVDNHVAVHGRSSYRPRFDGTDRWLQRTFVVEDLAPSEADRDGRVITTCFV